MKQFIRNAINKPVVVFLGLCTAVLCIAAIGSPAKHVNGGTGEWPSRLTNGTALQGTNYFDCGTAKDVGLEFVAKLTASGTDPTSIIVQASETGTKWADFKPTGIAMNGTSEVVLVTNIQVLGHRYIRCLLTNASGAFLTNYSVTFNAK